MLIECGYCGAPLDVQVGTSTTKCRYCERTSRTESQRTIAPQTPPHWKPPKKWRPPVHVPADSNVELRYHASTATTMIVLGAAAVFVVGTVVAGAMLRRGGVSAITPGIDPAKLDEVTFLETPTELAAKIGGKYDESAKWVTAPMKSPFSNAVFTYWGDDKSRPSGITLNFGDEGCTAEKTAIRDRLAERLAPRFDGKSWDWGSARLTFDEKCSYLTLGTDVGKEEDAYAERQAVVLWRLARAEIFGREAELEDAELRGLLGRGYDAKTIAAALAKTTIDDAKKKIESAAPGSFVSAKEARIPLESDVFSHVAAQYENKKGGRIETVYLTTLRYAKHSDPVALASCVAKKTGAKLGVHETDYAAKKSSADLHLGTTRAYVSESSFTVNGSPSGAVEDEALAAIVTAAAACAK